MSDSINADKLLNNNDILINPNSRVSIRVKERSVRVRIGGNRMETVGNGERKERNPPTYNRRRGKVQEAPWVPGGR